MINFIVIYAKLEERKRILTLTGKERYYNLTEKLSRPKL